MSGAKCEVCGKSSRRRMGRFAPEGWAWGEAKDDETGEAIIVMVCSPECKEHFWKPWDEGSTVADEPEKMTEEQLKARFFDLLDEFDPQTLARVLIETTQARMR